MARLVRFFQALRRHKKKTIFFSAVLGFGINYGHDKYEENTMMRELCEEALSYGEVSRPLGEADRHITVLLNPAAQDGKSKAAFEKYCAPLLHLAGLKVAVVRTEHEGQARDLMGVMEKTSAVVVAGGDGTLAEVLTGLLRRPDHTEASRRFPIGILPLGSTNTAASAIWGFTGASKPKHLAQATMAVVRDLRRPLDVMEITPEKAPEQEESPQPVFAASEVMWGAVRDAATRKDQYWYWPGVKKYMTYVFSSYKDISWDCSAEVNYTLPCSGCSKCRTKPQPEVKKLDTNAQRPRRWWMNYLPRATPVISKEEKDDEPDYSLITNESCGEQHHLSLGKVCEVTVATGNTLHSSDTPSYALTLKTGIEDIGAVDFISEGWRREWSGVRQYVEEKLVGQLSITPTAPTTTEKGEERELSIDNENFEVRPMTLRPRPKAVTIFAPPCPPLAQAAA